MLISGHTYFVINQKSGTAFDLSGEDHRSIIGYHLHRGDNQKWTFVDHYRGWTIQNVASGKYLDVDIPNIFREGERVVAITTDNPMYWQIRHDDYFEGWRIFRYIQIDGINLNVDLSDYGNPADRTPVTLWGEWMGQNQVWRLEEA